VSVLRVQQRKPHILRPDRATLYPGNQNEVTRRPLINEPEQMLKRTKFAMHLQSLALARCHQGHTHSASHSQEISKPKH
jgi:hypothetical protein